MTNHTEPATLKPLCLTTDLVAQGKATCRIVTPDDDAHKKLAGHLAQRLRDLTGMNIPMDMRGIPHQCHIIALGQMMNNPLIERLYWNRYLFADSLWPGPGGWAVQTVHSPYPWAAGYNVIALCGSDANGVALAVDAFLEGLEPGADLSVPYTCRVQLPRPEDRATDYVVLGRTYSEVRIPERDLTDQEAHEIEVAEPQQSLLVFQEHAARYLITGHPAYLRAARNVLLRMCEIYEADPHRKETWPEETNSRSIFAMWDAVEEGPAFTDEERLRITHMFLKFLHALVARTSDYGMLEDNDTIVWNHTTFPLLGLYWGGRYFRRYYDMAEMGVYLRKAAGAFRGQEKSWKPQCDADSYLVLTMSHTIEYALAEGKMAFFESGNIRKYADYLMGIADNRGWAAGFGDSGLQETNRIPLAGIPYAFWYTGQPRYLAYLNAVCGGKWPNPYHQDVHPEPPKDIVGVSAYPLDRQVYDYTRHKPYYNEPSGPPNIPFEQAFDKIAYRAGLGELDQYFLLDGYARGKHLHYDGNAILKLTDAGQDWLIDADYLVRNTTEHNMVSVVRNGRVEHPVPECAGLLHCADLPGYGLTRTVVRDDNGVDWYRDILWKKGDWIVVLDRLQAREDADYRFDCVWKTLGRGDIRLEDNATFSVTRPLGGEGTEAGTFFVRNASGAACTLRSRIGTPGPVVMLVQRQTGRLEKGEWQAFQNLLYLDRTGGSKSYSLEKLDEQTVFLRGPGPQIIGSGPFGREGLTIDAAAFCVGQETIILAGLVELRWGGIHLKPGEPVAAEIDTAAGRATVSVSEKTEIALRGRSPLQVPEGLHRIALDISDVERRILSDTLGGTRPTARPPTADPPAAFTGMRTLQELWRIEPEEDAEIRAVAGWNVADRPGRESVPRLLVCQGRKLKCYGPGGVIYWTFTTRQLVRCLAVADLNGDGRPEILCGGDDEHIHLLDHTGHELRAHRMVEQLIVGQGGTQQPFVNALLTGDFDGDGSTRIVAGCTNSQISMFDSDFNRIWNRGGIYHGVRKLMSADINADGRPEILAADHYGSVHVIAPNGDYLGRAYSELGDVAFDVGDIDGDGCLEIVNGSGTGVTAAIDSAFETRWQFNNYSYNTRQVVCCDLNGDGKSETLLASDTGYVYALDGKGKVWWQADLGAAVVALAARRVAEDKTEFAAGLISGDLVILDGRGKVTATHPGSAPVKFIATVDHPDADAQQIIVVDTENRLRVLL